MFPGIPFSGNGGGGVSPVNPSVVNNFPSFSNVTGGMQDSGFSGASFPILSPTTSARNIIQSTAIGVIPLISKGFLGQTANIFEVHKSDTTVLASISPAGLGNFIGGVTTAQTIIAGISDVVQLSVTPNGTQTNPTVKFFTTVVGKEWKFSNTGGVIHQSPDDATSSGEAVYTASRNYTGYSGSTLSNGVFQAGVTYTPSSNTASAKIAAIRGRITKSGSFDGGSATPSWLIGVLGDVTPVTNGNTFRYIGVAGSVQPSGSGTVVHVISMLADVSGSMTSGLTNQYGVLVASTSTLGINSTYTSTPTNLYGLYMENITRGLTLNYAVFTNSGVVHFGDNAEIVGSKDAIQLSVTPNGTQTNPTVKFFTSTAGKDFQFSKTGGIIHNPVDDATSGEYIYTAAKTYTSISPINLLIGAINDVVTYTPSGNAGSSAQIAAMGGTVNKKGNFNGGSAGAYMAGLYGAVGIDSSVTAGTTYKVAGVVGTTSINNNSGGTTTNVIGVLASLGGAAGSLITNVYGVAITVGNVLGIATMSATPTNLYGLYIEDLTLGTSLNYSIYTNSGSVHFGGNVDIIAGANLTMASGNVVFTNGNLSFASASGSKIGLVGSQKIGIWGVTPIIQPASANQAILTNSTGGTYDGTLVDVTTAAVSDPAKVNSNFTDIFTLLDAMRTALVNSGIMKGSA